MKNEIPEGWHIHKNGGGLVQDTAIVEDSAYIGEAAQVYGNAKVYGNAQVFDDAQVYGNAWVFADAWVRGNAHVYGNAQVSGKAQVSGDARVSGNARVSGDAWVSGDARVYGDAWGNPPFQLHGSKDYVNISKIDYLKIGCIEMAIKEWKKQYREVGKENNYSLKEIKEYGLYIELAEKINKTYKVKSTGGVRKY